MAQRSSLENCTSALRVAQRVFALSTSEPTNLVLYREEVDGAEGLPEGRLLLPPLRDLLLRAHTPPATKDAVWRVLIRRARADRSAWLVAALGMAMPGLRREVRGLSVACGGERDDLESAVAEGFVTELFRVDLTATALCARLVRAGGRAGIRQVYRDAAPHRPVYADFASHPPRVPWGHPDLLLVDAVRAGVISSDDARLIAVTRLEGVAVDTLAHRSGELVNTVVVRRRRAERRLRDAILSGSVTCGPDLAGKARSGREGQPERAVSRGESV